MLAELESLGRRAVLDDMKNRYGIHVAQAWGVPVGKIKAIGKRLGRDHDLAQALWQAGWYEARMLAAFVDEPERVTVAQMDRWCDDFDNWGICDTVCFALFDRTPHAFGRIAPWSAASGEFQKRAATDERNFVKKAVHWALRAIGQRSAGLHTAAVAVAERLAGSGDATARWVGKGVLKDLMRPLVQKRLARRARAAGTR